MKTRTRGEDGEGFLVSPLRHQGTRDGGEHAALPHVSRVHPGTAEEAVGSDQRDVLFSELLTMLKSDIKLIF